MRYGIRVMTAICAVLLVALNASAADPMAAKLNPPLPKDVTLTKDVLYRVVGGEKLLMDIYRPNSVGDGVAPAVVFVHGGGWQGGDRTNGFGFKRDTYPLLAAGFIVVSIDYRLAPKHLFPAQIEDSKAAVRFVRANAKRFHIDADHIGAMGESAGGHLVALLGLVPKSAGFDVGENLDQSSAVEAVVDLYGVHDVGRFNHQKLKDAVFPKDLVKSASPVTYIAAGAPPFLVIHGDRDGMVPVEQSDLFVKALKEARVPVKYIRVKNANHGLWEVGGPLDPPMEQITREIAEFFKKNL